ncbi:hypothetical protein Taro_017515 [Colocasia esculenta]|uniref:Uncharacterized protein n=1 Tax=Colocasia esculenta TaxID=4460 RepID=A0A843URK2_COLES|nr:hypothetical protein [Colocasia esculenta]
MANSYCILRYLSSWIINPGSMISLFQRMWCLPQREYETLPASDSFGRIPLERLAIWQGISKSGGLIWPNFVEPKEEKKRVALLFGNL